ncbi:protoglobin domain-containing protein [Chitinophaga sp. Cy-1792]|uniref:protoglobin domain-containing protein n=1 Tax=Chitinophaga sp. Cy-1792 TaxID=2608339 RepID=UPI001422FC4F|nr:protoglobin domain-containing protein [Chitinophaga sp. Cy-1792]
MQKNEDLIDDTDGSVPAITLRELILLKRLLLYTRKDEELLREAAPMLKQSATGILRKWYAFIQADNYLAQYFSDIKDEDAFLASRMGEWLNQLLTIQEIPHADLIERKIKEGDSLNMSLDPALLRYLVAFSYPVINAGNEVLYRAGYKEAILAGMQLAWYKAVTLSVALWAYPFRASKSSGTYLSR